MVLYTSYFGRIKDIQRAGLKPVSVSLWVPKWYTGERALELAPAESTLRKYKAGRLTNDEYLVEFAEVLKKLNPRKVARQFDGCALMCYEKSDDFCHRHLIREWLSYFGIDSEEWDGQKIQRQEKRFIQQSLF